jgi:predicted amidohydrolase
MKKNIIIYQKALGIEIPNRDIKEMKEFNPDFICFPEYFFVDQKIGNLDQTIENQEKQILRIKNLSIKLDCTIIGGTMPEMADGKIFNTSYIFSRGEMLGFYRKKNLFFAEEGKITPGDEYKIFSAEGINFGVLICADVFFKESFSYMKEHGSDIIFLPTFSLYKEEEADVKFKRDRELYVTGANYSDSVIVKVCGVKSEFKPFLQARSLIADKNDIIYRVEPHEEDKEMIIKKTIELNQ